MDIVKLRAWWFHRQGLEGGRAGQLPETVLAQTGWSRSVGGANPYLALFARAGISRAETDKAIADVQIHELPSARGCTYVVPACDYATALTVGQGSGDSGDFATAVKFLGYSHEEAEGLDEKVCLALETGPQDPRQLKATLGDAVRSFGDEGKKRGVTTTLPLSLGRLQSQGRIRRIPVNGRIDNQRYSYALWDPSPLAGPPLSREEAFQNLARSYFKWIGPATLKNFQWLSGLGVKSSNDAVADLGLVPTEPGSDLLLLPDDFDGLASFRTPSEPRFALLGSIDNVSHLRLGLPDLIDAADTHRLVPGEKSMLNLTGLSELSCNSIIDRGRLVGVWDFDAESQSLVWTAWVDKSEELVKEVGKTETFIREQLGDARTFSLDSPESRKSRLASLRELAAV